MASILNADNGVISGSAGLKMSSDTSGILNLQTNGTTAISISASQVVSFGATSSIDFSGAVSLSGGTANGVAYLNGSKVVTTGSALTFDGTTLTATALAGPHNGTVGATTPNTGSFTTLTASSTTTLSGGTANGVAYLNGSKVVTTGSALGFDGTNLLIGGTTQYGKVTSYGYVTSVGDGTAAGLVIRSSSGRDSYGIFDVNESSSASALGFYWVDGNADPSTGTERMRIDSSGNLGIGTSSPTQLLHVRKDQAAYTWGRFDNQSSSASAYAGVQLGAYGNTWGLVIGSSAATSNALQFVLDAGGTNAEKMRLDTSGNLGLGVTPSAWSGFTALEFSNGNSLYTNGGQMSLGSNAYNNAGWKYKATSPAGLFTNVQGTFTWYTAPSGTAGNAISFTQAMTLTSAGIFLVGNTSPNAYGGQAAIAEFYGPVVSAADSDGGNVAILGKSNTAGAGGALVMGAMYNGSNYGTWGRIRAPKDTSVNNEYGGGLAFDTRANSSNFAERARITSGGNFCINTTAVTSSAKLNVTTSGNQAVAIAAIGSFYQDNGPGSPWVFGKGSYDNTNSGFDICCGVGSAPFVRLDVNGNLLRGYTATGLQNTNSFAADQAGYIIQNHVSGTGSTTRYAYFGYNAAEIGSISQNGTTAVAFNTSSDRRLKDNIVPAPSAGDDIDAIQIVSHDWKSAPDEHVKYGVIAQDLYPVAPQAVSVGDDGEEIEQTWGVDYSKLVPMLIKEVQSLRARLAALESK